MVSIRHAVLAICSLVMVAEAPSAHTVNLAQPQKPATRRSQRVQMSAVDVRSPNGLLTFTLLPNAERLTFTVTLADSGLRTADRGTTVIEPSPIVLTLDGYDLSAGV